MSELPEALFQLKLPDIRAFLTVPDIAVLHPTSRHFHSLFKPELKKAKLQKLLKHVVHGEQDKAAAILRTEPELLIERGDITDYAGRTFHNVSPWECMLWALDTRYMGQMMLACIPEGEAGNAIRGELSVQYDAMQGGGSDLVRIDGEMSPIDMPLEALETRFNNKDAIISWNNQLYYAKKGSPPAVLIAPTITDVQRDAFHRLETSLERMPPNTARKSTPEEHALIAATTHHTLGRKGIHYEQSATYKSLVAHSYVDLHVHLYGRNIGDMPFAQIAMFFDTDDALLFWNDQFYYANKVDSTVTLITPTSALSPEEIASFSALKASLARRRGVSITLEEHQLINTLFREHPAFKPTYHCDSHYDFELIGALQMYIDLFDELEERAGHLRCDELWINKVGRAQRKSPSHVLHHYCDPNRSFNPTPDFKAMEFKRRGQIYDSFSQELTNLFSSGSLDGGLGFQFGIIRGSDSLSLDGFRIEASAHRPRIHPSNASIDLLALQALYKVRMDDAKVLQNKLNQSLVLASSGPTAVIDLS